MKIIAFRILSLILLILLLSRCEKDIERSFPSMRTLGYEIIENGVILKGEILNWSSLEIDEYGFTICEGPITDNSDLIAIYVNKELISSKYELSVTTGLEEGKIYTFISYAISNGYLSLGGDMEFVSGGSEPPELLGFYPTSGHSGDTLGIACGNLFGSPDYYTVKFNDVESDIIFYTDSALFVTVPRYLDSLSNYLTVSAFGQTSGFDNPFTIQTPVIQSFSPQEVYPGEEVVIQGFSFPEHTDYLEVFFNGVIAEVISSSYSSIKVLAPFPSDSMNTIQIRCDRQRVYSDNQIKVCLPDKAIISPTSGTFLDRISIQGPGIGDTHLYIRNVTIGSSITHIIERNLNEIIVEVPEWIGPNESVVRINYENDTIICSNTFFLNEVEINSLSDNSIVAGEDLHIYGNNFNPNKVRNRVFIGDSLYYPYEASSSQLKVRTSISQPAGDYIVAVQTCGSVVPFAELLNIIQSPWTELSGFPSGILIGSGSCSDGEYGYVGLGKSYSGFMEDIYQYSVSYDDWNKIADFPGQPRTNPLSFVIDGKVFFGGGKDGAPAYNNPQSYFDYYEYDPDLDQWGDILVYPGTSSYDYNGTSEVVNGRCYISSDSYEFYEFTRGETQPWRRLSTPADGIYSQAASFSLGDVIYFVGGLDKRTSTSVKKSEVWAYNTNSNTWEKKSDIPAGVRYDGVAFVIDGMAYFGLGADFYLQDDLWRYDPQDDQWTFVSRMPPGGRLNPFCFVIGNIAYLGLGTSGYSPTFTDIYSFEPAY